MLGIAGGILIVFAVLVGLVLVGFLILYAFLSLLDKAKLTPSETPQQLAARAKAQHNTTNC